jgi:superfamily II DNA or RNA helicase
MNPSELRKALTVRPIEKYDGLRPPSFKVYRDVAGGKLLVPRFFEGSPKTTCTKGDAAPNITFSGTLRHHQKEALQAFKGNGVLCLPCGQGKCLGIDTPILMFDGSVKMVQDVLVGDVLMGDDSTPRNVLSTCTGQEMLYDVIPTKGNTYRVNESHILSLKYSSSSKKGQIIDIPLLDYLALPSAYHGRAGILLGYRVPIQFPEQKIDFDPYMIGYWLGDGSSNCCRISSQDSSVLKYFAEELPKWDCILRYSSQYDYNICGINRLGNKMLKELQKCNLIKNKHIPMKYKCNSRQIQLQVLAGLIDSDGYLIGDCGFEYSSVSEKLFDDVLFIARSLGFSCYKKKKKTTWTYNGMKKYGTTFLMTINGNGIEDIPTKIPRKKSEVRRQIKDVLVTRIKIQQVGLGDYYGFEIDGNHRFLLGDFTVTHNTATSLAIASKYKRKTLVIVHKEILADQWEDRIGQFCPGVKVGRIQGNRWETDAPFVLAMIQTLCIREFPKGAFDQFGFIIIDEAHHIGAPAFSQVMLGMNPEYTLGLSATPERKDGLTKILYWFLGPMFYKMDAQVEGELVVHKLSFDCAQYKTEIPTVNRAGKICLPTNITRLTEFQERNDFIIKHIKNAQSRGRKILVLSDRRAHCEYIKNALDNAILSMGGSVDPPALKDGANTLVSTFGLAREGLDIPELDTLFIVTPISDVVQALGRITRGPGTKEVHDIVDHWSIFESMWYKRNATYKGPKEKKCLFT